MVVSKLAKADRLLKEDRVFLVNETRRNKYFIVGGRSEIYNVVYDKIKDKWSCTCRNIREVDCYHIVACKKMINYGNTEPSIKKH